MNIKDITSRQNGAKGRKWCSGSGGDLLSIVQARRRDHRSRLLFRQPFVKWKERLERAPVGIGYHQKRCLISSQRGDGMKKFFYNSVIHIGELKRMLRPKTMTALHLWEVI